MDVRNVYIVDDDDIIRLSAVSSLRSAGFHAVAFENGEAFVAQMHALARGCILLDVRMPGIDGFQVMEAISGMSGNLKVVFMTGHGDVATAVRAMKQGAVDFLEKPFDDRALIETVDRVSLAFGSHLEEASRRLDARHRLQTLSGRETDVLRGLASGLPNKLIAYELGISTRTVEMHRSNLMNKLDVKSLAETLRLALLAGLLTESLG